MGEMVEGLGLIIICMIIVGFLSRIIPAGRGGGFLQAEMFTSLFAVVLVAILATGIAFVWLGGFQLLKNMYYSTFLTIGVLVVITTIAVKLSKAMKPKSV